MRIGTMDHFVEVYRYVDQTSESGMRSKVRESVCSLRCHLLKKEGVFKEKEKEQFDTISIVLETWRDDNVRDTDLLCYCGQEFRIVFIDYSDLDRIMKITAKKIIK